MKNKTIKIVGNEFVNKRGRRGKEWKRKPWPERGTEKKYNWTNNLLGQALHATLGLTLNSEGKKIKMGVLQWRNKHLE